MATICPFRSSYSAPKRTALSDKCPGAQLTERLLQLGLRVHHDRPMPGDGLFDRFARHQKEANSLIAGLHRYLVAAVEQYERAIAGLIAHQSLIGAVGLLGEHAEWLRCRTEIARALEHVGERVAFQFDGQRFTHARRHGDVEVARVGGDALGRAALAEELAADHAYARAVILDYLGDFCRLHV